MNEQDFRQIEEQVMPNKNTTKTPKALNMCRNDVVDKHIKQHDVKQPPKDSF